MWGGSRLPVSGLGWLLSKGAQTSTKRGREKGGGGGGYRAGLPGDEDGGLPREGEHVLETLTEVGAVVIRGRAGDQPETGGILCGARGVTTRPAGGRDARWRWKLGGEALSRLQRLAHAVGAAVVVLRLPPS